jgi:all-trans-retinol 13,14-reductase
MSVQPRRFGAIVIGSGAGGLAAAASLAKCGRRVLVLEQHWQLGGLTQTFSRQGYEFATGLHYVGGAGEAPCRENQFGALLRWLTDGQLRFASLGSPYDIVRLPDFEFSIPAPRAAHIEGLKRAFPAEANTIEGYFTACEAAEKAAMALLAAKALPAPLALALRTFNGKRISRALGTTTAEAVRNVSDPRLASLLTARWGNYGLPPAQAPLAVHALVMGSYSNGAYYPVGGPGRFAQAMGEVVQAAGGELRTQAAVAEISLASGRVTGVRLADGEPLDAPLVVSAMGARNTAAALPAGVVPPWRRDVESMKSGLSYVALYVGLRGDIRAHGASPANVWIYEREDIGGVWNRPLDEEAPALFVSFPSLKDPAHRDPARHTAEVVALCRWEPFSAWSASEPEHRPEDYQLAKAWIAENLLGQFKRHFPRLAPLVDFHEISTPLSQAAFVRADRGAMYGLEMSPRRMTHRALRARTPVRGLVLAGQDAATPGIQGAFMGGFIAAASIERRLWTIYRNALSRRGSVG